MIRENYLFREFSISNIFLDKIFYHELYLRKVLYVYVYIYDRLKRYYSNYSKIHLYANRRIIWQCEGAINYGNSPSFA